ANALTFSPDGRFLAVAGNIVEFGVTVWDTTTWTSFASWRFDGSQFVPFALAFSADSKSLFYEKKDGWLGRWSLETRETLPAIPPDGETRSTQRLLFSRDGKWAATGSRDGVVKVWSLPGWKRLYRRTNEWLLAISDQDDLLLTTSNQQLHLSSL